MSSPRTEAPRPSSVFLRTASLPFELLERWGQPASAAGEPTYSAVQREVRAWASSALGAEALWLASPSLHEALVRDGAGKDEQLDRSLWRYAARMAGRATPFGTFASVGVGHAGPGPTELRLAGPESARKRVQLDARALLELASRWQGMPEVQPLLRFFPAPQTWAQGDVVRCIPLRLGPASGPAGLIELPLKPPLRAVLEASREGLTLGQLDDVLARQLPRAAPTSRQRYLLRLVEEGVLQSELVPCSTGPDLFSQLRASVAPLPPLSEPLARLQEAHERLQQLGQAPGTPVSRYQQVAHDVMGALEITVPTPFHVDLWRPLVTGNLGADVVRELRASAAMLASLPAAPSDRLHAFRDRFLDRYDTRYIPLLDALDDDRGVGFSTASFLEDIPLLEGVPLGGPAKSEAISLSGVEQVLLRRLLEATARGEREIRLRDDELGVDEGKLPASFAVFSSLAGPPGDPVLLSPALMSPSGLSMLGRFTTLDPALERSIRQVVEDEEQGAGGDLIVDLIDLPSGPLANVITRPVLSSHELILQGRSGAPLDRQILAGDLLVGVEGERVVLYSRRLGRRVRVRATNAFNPQHPSALPLHQFLDLLESQDRVGRMSLSWGPLARSAAFLPRLVYRRAILQPATWNLTADEWARLGSSRGAALQEVAGLLRQRHALPRWVSVAEGDQILPIDLDNPLALEVLGQVARSKPPAPLREFLPALLARGVQGPDGSHVNEILVPFSSPPRPGPAVSPPRGHDDPSQALVPPGQSPLYASVFGSPRMLEKWLLEALPGVLAVGEDVERWFFVRLREGAGGHHLRLRLFGDPGALWQRVQPRLSRSVAESIARGALTGLRFDTYQREVERYGGPDAILLAEQVFCADTRCVVQLLEARREPAMRWRLALLGLDALLADFGLDARARQAFAERSTRNFRREFGDREELDHGLGQQFRALRGEVREALSREGDVWDAAREAIEQRSASLQPWLTRLRPMFSGPDGSLDERRWYSLAWNHGHLFCNRLFDRSARAQEMVLYSHLARHWRSELARSRP